MVIFRIVAALMLLSAGVCFGFWLVTKQVRWWRWTLLMLKLMLALAIVVFGLLVLERVVMLV